MTFTRANPLGWAAYEVFLSSQCNHIDLNQSRALDGYAGGTWSPTALIAINNAFEADATGSSLVNANGVTGTGKGTGNGVIGTSGPTAPASGVAGGGIGTGCIGVSGLGGPDGHGGYFVGGTGNGIGVEATGTGTETGLKSTGGASSGEGAILVGGGPNGIGAVIAGQGTGLGIDVAGGSNAAGLHATAGGGNNVGVQGSGKGTQAGVLGIGDPIGTGPGIEGTTSTSAPGALFSSASGAAMRLVVQASDPASPVNGDYWVRTDGAYVRLNGEKQHTVPVWGAIDVQSGTPSLLRGFGISGVALSPADNKLVRISFGRSFSNDDYAVQVTQHRTLEAGYSTNYCVGASISTVSPNDAKNLTWVDVGLVDVSTGSLIDLSISNMKFDVTVQGTY